MKRTRSGFSPASKEQYAELTRPGSADRPAWMDIRLDDPDDLVSNHVRFSQPSGRCGPQRRRPRELRRPIPVSALEMRVLRSVLPEIHESRLEMPQRLLNGNTTHLG